MGLFDTSDSAAWKLSFACLVSVRTVALGAVTLQKVPSARNRQKHARWVGRWRPGLLTPSLAAPWAVEPCSLPCPAQTPLTALPFAHQMGSRCWVTLPALSSTAGGPRFVGTMCSGLWVPWDDVRTTILCPSHTLRTPKPGCWRATPGPARLPKGLRRSGPPSRPLRNIQLKP